MILAIDIGNTNIKYGIYEGLNLKASFRVSSAKNRTADEYGATICALLSYRGFAPKDITGIIMSSVIPSLNYTMQHMCSYFFGIEPLMVGPGIKTGLNLKVENPREVGADRIASSVGAYVKYGGPVIVIDFGTATTFHVVSGKGELLGGAISPGIKGSLDSLVQSAAKLPHIELETPTQAIAKNTVTNMQAGVVYGFAGLTEKIVKKMKEELKASGANNVRVIATGGLGEIISKEADCIDVVDRTLTLDGLAHLYRLNGKESTK
ncbi:MAG: type III pantothenate kinase [Clostridiales bacterium]|nr:type III pantothenate kinase [Clostridiales bacterium]